MVKELQFRTKKQMNSHPVWGDPLRWACSSCHGGGIEVLPTVVFADSKHVLANLIGMFDLFDQVAHTVRRTDGETRVVVCRCEAIDTDLHFWALRENLKEPAF